MKCDDALRRIIEHDDGARYPARLRLHLRRCARCRAEAEGLRFAVGALRRGPLPVPDIDVSDAVMAEIGRMESYGRNVPLYNWLGGGLAIVGGIVLVSFSDSFALLRNSFGRNFEMPLSIVLGLAITLYASAFIAIHLDVAGAWMVRRRG
ncbi:MAG TPA: hypothetical protein VLM75_12975 [Spirochaetota bacterium]|nr:hypothetical protein [Spirochaetota bacterium]